MDYNVINFGATADGQTKDTAAIQCAIDTCHAQGGGRLLFPAGNYLTGTLYWKSHVELHLQNNAVLLGSTDIDDYSSDTYHQIYAGEPHMDRCLIYAEAAHDICLSGWGMINGQGESFSPDHPVETARPMMFRYKDCHDIRISGVKLRNPASWTNAFIRCQNIWVDGIDIYSRANWNGDGLDFDGCQNVFVSNCLLDCSDDCICLQSSEPGLSCRNIVIQNCIMKSKWAGIRIGLLSRGDIEQVAVSNCCFADIECSALKIQAAEGGAIRDMVFSNLVMERVQRPLFITLNHYRYGKEINDTIPHTSRVKNLHFSHIRASGRPESPIALRSCIILDGIPGHCIEEITIDAMQYTAVGGGSLADAARTAIPDFVDRQPECFTYDGPLPAFGVFARHVRGLRLRHVNIEVMHADLRQMIYSEDCDGLEVSG